MGVPGNADLLLLRSAAAEGGYTISRSLRFNASDSAYLSRTPASAGNRKTWTWAGWVKRSGLGAQLDFASAGDSGDYVRIAGFDSSDRLTLRTDGAVVSLVTTQVFRDCSAWYHIVVAFDTTQTTASNRIKFYVNGSQITVFTTAAYPSQNTDWAVNNTGEHRIGAFRDKTDPTVYFPFSGYLADVHFIDGQALDPSSFTEVSATTGQLIPKQYTGSFGTNGFWLKFSDNSAATATTLGKDYSGNSNNWTPNNLSVTAGAGNDSLVDTPTSVSATDTGIGGEIRGNYATFNPIGTVKPATGVIPTLTNGNLDATHSGGSWQYANSTIAVPAGSGKYYCEFYISSSYAPDYIAVGVNPATASNFSATVHSSSQSGIFYSNNGEKWVTGSNSAYGSAYTTGDLIGVALNCDSGQITFYKNNTSQGAISFNSNLTNGGTIYFTIDIHTSNLVANFGQRQWAYAAPSGFRPLVDTLLPTPVVAKPNTVMDIALYTGNGAARSITGFNFGPDLVWIKRRDSANSHRLFDAVRGAGAHLTSNGTDAESTTLLSLSAFNSNGFSLGDNTDGQTNVNISGGSYVAWAFDAGSNTVSNTAGSITSQVRANASAGFSIVTYTSSSSVSTVGHGLGVAPHLIITKNRSVSNTWWTYHSAIGNTKAMRLDTTAAETTISSTWNNTSPTSTVFTVGGEWGSGNSIVAYCFAPVAGYSSFGSYVGNGDSSGPFIWTGFRPRWVMWKPVTQSATDWVIRDAARDSYNVVSNYLLANTAGAEGAIAEIDFLSNGFKFRNNLSGNNTNGVQVIYACFAEAPFQYARAR